MLPTQKKKKTQEANTFYAKYKTSGKMGGPACHCLNMLWQRNHNNAKDFLPLKRTSYAFCLFITVIIVVTLYIQFFHTIFSVSPSICLLSFL